MYTSSITNRRPQAVQQGVLSGFLRAELGTSLRKRPISTHAGVCLRSIRVSLCQTRFSYKAESKSQATRCRLGKATYTLCRQSRKSNCHSARVHSRCFHPNTGIERKAHDCRARILPGLCNSVCLHDRFARITAVHSLKQASSRLCTIVCRKLHCICYVAA